MQTLVCILAKPRGIQPGGQHPAPLNPPTHLSTVGRLLLLLQATSRAAC